MRALIPEAFGAPIGRYVPGVEVETASTRLVSVTGQVAVDSTGETVGLGDVVRQTEQVFDNLQQVLAEAGAGLADLLSVTVYLTDREDFEGFNKVRNRVFAQITPPSSTVVIVAGLVVPGHLVEVSALAVVAAEPPKEQR
ncbi:RidA family protein [Streptomyces sp. NPDC058964]|uniref:RidA family protein n=1 Tax=Streptomyces sp. NPDC058964 TaxID=3346681 RepID=UPI0036A941C8